MNDTVTITLVCVGLASMVGLIVFFALKSQAAIASKQIDDIENKDMQIEKEIDNMSLSDLVDSNNKQKGDSKQ